MRIVSCRVTLFSSSFSQQQQQQHTTFFSVPSKKKNWYFVRPQAESCRLSVSVRPFGRYIFRPTAAFEFDWGMGRTFLVAVARSTAKGRKIKPYFQTSVWHQQNNNNNSRDEQQYDHNMWSAVAVINQATSQDLFCVGLYIPTIDDRMLLSLLVLSTN